MTEQIQTSNESLEENQQNTPKNLLAERFRGFYPVVLDVETAGFNPKTDALLEVAAITLKFNENGDLVRDQSFHYNIEPFHGSVLNEENLKFLGIDPYNPLRGAVSEKDSLIPLFKALSKLAKANGCKRTVLIGHNAHFDHSFIMAANERLNYKRCPFHPFSVIDTASLSSVFLGQSVLRVACLTAGIEFDNSQAHGALYDTEREAELFCYFVNKLKSLGGWPLPPDVQKVAQEAAIDKSVYHKETTTSDSTTDNTTTNNQENSEATVK